MCSTFFYSGILFVVEVWALYHRLFDIINRQGRLYTMKWKLIREQVGTPLAAFWLQKLRSWLNSEATNFTQKQPWLGDRTNNFKGWDLQGWMIPVYNIWTIYKSSQFSFEKTYIVSKHPHYIGNEWWSGSAWKEFADTETQVLAILSQMIKALLSAMDGQTKLKYFVACTKTSPDSLI